MGPLRRVMQAVALHPYGEMAPLGVLERTGAGVGAGGRKVGPQVEQLLAGEEDPGGTGSGAGFDNQQSPSGGLPRAVQNAWSSGHRQLTPGLGEDHQIVCRKRFHLKEIPNNPAGAGGFEPAAQSRKS